jgi:hypothetical protein
VDDYNLSQIVRRCHTAEAVIGALVIEPPASFLPAEASDPLKADTITASILRTHSQCQRGARCSITSREREDLVSSSLENLWLAALPANMPSL